MQNIVLESFSPEDECVFGTPSYSICDEFYRLYKAKIGLCKMKLSADYLTGPIGYFEYKGLYMAETVVQIPYYGQSPKALVNRVKRIQKLLEKTVG